MPFPSPSLHPACLPLTSTGKYMQRPRKSYTKEMYPFHFSKKFRLQTQHCSSALLAVTQLFIHIIIPCLSQLHPSVQTDRSLKKITQRKQLSLKLQRPWSLAFEVHDLLERGQNWAVHISKISQNINERVGHSLSSHLISKSWSEGLFNVFCCLSLKRSDTTDVKFSFRKNPMGAAKRLFKNEACLSVIPAKCLIAEIMMWKYAQNCFTL